MYAIGSSCWGWGNAEYHSAMAIREARSWHIVGNYNRGENEAWHETAWRSPLEVQFKGL
jgi:hypothetical protein